ncbi:MAG: hypothetical protein RR513_10065, partial [Muribaculaceae bacterium]
YYLLKERLRRSRLIHSQAKFCEFCVRNAPPPVQAWHSYQRAGKTLLDKNRLSIERWIAYYT